MREIIDFRDTKCSLGLGLDSCPWISAQTQAQARMRHVAAYLLAGLGGNLNPTADDIVYILRSVGIEPNFEKLGVVMSKLQGKNMDELMAAGAELLSEMRSPEEKMPAPVEESPESAKEESKATEADTEESDEDLGFGLFD